MSKRTKVTQMMMMIMNDDGIWSRLAVGFDNGFTWFDFELILSWFWVDFELILSWFWVDFELIWVDLSWFDLILSWFWVDSVLLIVKLFRFDWFVFYTIFMCFFLFSFYMLSMLTGTNTMVRSLLTLVCVSYTQRGLIVGGCFGEPPRGRR